MTSGRHKSNTYRKVEVKSPGGRVKTQYKKKKPSKARCAECGAILKGVPTERATNMQNMPKTKRRPQRPYGGKLCSRCMRKKIKENIE